MRFINFTEIVPYLTVNVSYVFSSASKEMKKDNEKKKAKALELLEPTRVIFCLPPRDVQHTYTDRHKTSSLN